MKSRLRKKKQHQKRCVCTRVAVMRKNGSYLCATCAELEARLKNPALTRGHTGIPHESQCLYSHGWFDETRRMVDRGYQAFCARRGLNPLVSDSMIGHPCRD